MQLVKLPLAHAVQQGLLCGSSVSLPGGRWSSSRILSLEMTGFVPGEVSVQSRPIATKPKKLLLSYRCWVLGDENGCSQARQRT